jgi:SagB-type dehydrogenase family enzyme
MNNSTIFVIEPHFDDAAICVGGFLLDIPAKIHIISVFSLDSTVNPNFDHNEELEDLNIIRRNESRKYCEKIYAKNHFLDFQKTDRNIDSLVTKVLNIVDIDGLVLLPAGFGGHPDHSFVNELSNIFKNHILYEDIAPTAHYANVMSNFWPIYSKLINDYVPYYYNIEKEIDRKIELAKIYKSQFSSSDYNYLKNIARSTALSSKHLSTIKKDVFNFCERLYIPNKLYQDISTELEGRELKFSSKILNQIIHLENKPNAKLKSISLRKSLIERRTNRALNGYSIGLNDLSELLSISGGQVKRISIQGKTFPQFTFPTAGSFGSSKMSVIIWAGNDLERGVYRFDHENHKLLKTDLLVPSLIQVYKEMQQEWILGATICIMVEVQPVAAFEKYGFRAENILLLEAGHLFQNIQLIASALGLPHFMAGFVPLSLCNLAGKGSIVGLCFLSGKAETESISGGGDIFLSMATHSKEFSLLGKKIYISRCDLQINNFATTGTSSSHKVSEVKAQAEASEIFSSILIDSQGVEKMMMPDYGIHPQNIINDPIQLSRDIFRSDFFNERECYFWMIGRDLLDDSEIAVLTDFVTLSKRYNNHIQIATTVGMAAGENDEEAQDRALLELAEKLFSSYFILNWELIRHESIQFFINSVSGLPSANEIVFYQAVFHSFKIVRCFYKEKLLASSCNLNALAAISKCIEEAFSKIVYGLSSVSFEPYVASPSHVWKEKGTGSLLELLNSHNIRVGAFQIKLMPLYRPEKEFKVSKLIAYVKI